MPITCLPNGNRMLHSELKEEAMPVKTQLLSILVAPLLTASLALAAPAGPAAPQAPVVTAAQPLAAFSSADALCKGADLPIFSLQPQTAATETQTCGACSAAACVGKQEFSACGPDLRCIDGGPSCSAGSLSCRCLPIP
jgi:hypothetical protein